MAGGSILLSLPECSREHGALGVTPDGLVIEVFAVSFEFVR